MDIIMSQGYKKLKRVSLGGLVMQALSFSSKGTLLIIQSKPKLCYRNPDKAIFKDDVFWRQKFYRTFILKYTVAFKNRTHMNSRKSIRTKCDSIFPNSPLEKYDIAALLGWKNQIRT